MTKLALEYLHLTHFVTGQAKSAFIACGVAPLGLAGVEHTPTWSFGARFTGGWGGETIWREVTCSRCALFMDQVRANGIEAGRFKTGHGLRRHLRRLAERSK